jgi:hypothetical protein
MRNLQELNLNGGRKNIEVSDETWERIGFNLPEDYKEFIRFSNSGESPELNTFGFGTENECGVDDFFVIAESKQVMSYLEFMPRVADLPKRYFPFAIDGGSNLFCFEFSEIGELQGIVRLFADTRYRQATKLCQTFTEFIDGLELNPDYI